MGFSAYAEPVTTFPKRVIVHPEDGATVSHWPLQGSRNDTVGPNNWNEAESSIKYYRVNGLDDSSDLLAFTRRNSGNQTAPVTNLNTLTEMTIACWVFVNAYPSANTALAGIRSPGPGATNNFPWDLSIRTTGEIRFLWQSGTKVNNQVLSTTGAPLGIWLHVIATRNAAQDTARLYLFGERENEATGLSAHSGGASQTTLRFFSDGQGNNVNGGLFSVIVKNTEVNDVQARALYQSCLEDMVL